MTINANISQKPALYTLAYTTVGEEHHRRVSFLFLWYGPEAGGGYLAKNTPKEVIVDLGRGHDAESESERCQAGIVERFEIFKMASKMAAMDRQITKWFYIGQFLSNFQV